MDYGWNTFKKPLYNTVTQHLETDYIYCIFIMISFSFIFQNNQLFVLYISGEKSGFYTVQTDFRALVLTEKDSLLDYIRDGKKQQIPI